MNNNFYYNDIKKKLENSLKNYFYKWLNIVDVANAIIMKNAYN